jgi:RND family efflux transporter MFP subunit
LIREVAVTHRTVVLVLSSTLMAAACGGSKTSAPTSEAEGVPMVVATARAEMVDVPSVFEAGGVLRAGLTTTIASRMLATVITVHVRPGDQVRRGQTLVELDARELDANRAHAASALAAAEAAMHAADADVKAADAALTQARVTRDRIVTLVDLRSATPQERDDAVAAHAAAEARLAGARARLAAAASAVEAARAGADAAGIAASYATLTSPFDGIVAARRADPGDVATPGGALLVVEQAGAQHLEVTIDEARGSRIALHQAVRVRMDDVGDAALAGHVTEIARVDADSHSFVVKIELPPSAALKSGMYGRAEFDGSSHSTLVVPAASVISRGQLTFVFAVDGGQARLRQVSTGGKTSAGIEISAGLSGGETVIVSPGGTLRDGTRVTASGGTR